MGLDFLNPARQLPFLDQPLVETFCIPNPLPSADQMGRGIQAHRNARGLQDGVNHRRHRTLSPGSGNMNRSKRILGVAKPFEKCRHPFRTEIPFIGKVGGLLVVFERV